MVQKLNDFRRQLINDVLASVLPAMQADGGGVELVDVRDNTVFVKMIGSCLSCPSRSLTIQYAIEVPIKQRLSEIDRVVIVK